MTRVETRDGEEVLHVYLGPWAKWLYRLLALFMATASIALTPLFWSAYLSYPEPGIKFSLIVKAMYFVALLMFPVGGLLTTFVWWRCLGTRFEVTGTSISKYSPHRRPCVYHWRDLRKIRRNNFLVLGFDKKALVLVYGPSIRLAFRDVRTMQVLIGIQLLKPGIRGWLSYYGLYGHPWKFENLTAASHPVQGTDA